ncbi:hypothetical protein DFP73DRAFT_530910 [Morchella snyderi]|nr:hypothetical protein DFP73DRAFT_530910 [Morchella snyderi]
MSGQPVHNNLPPLRMPTDGVPSTLLSPNTSHESRLPASQLEVEQERRDSKVMRWLIASSEAVRGYDYDPNFNENYPPHRKEHTRPDPRNELQRKSDQEAEMKERVEFDTCSVSMKAISIEPGGLDAEDIKASPHEDGDRDLCSIRSQPIEAEDKETSPNKGENREIDGTEHQPVEAEAGEDFYQETHDERYKQYKFCPRTIATPYNTTRETIRNTPNEKIWRVHIRHCGGISVRHGTCRTYHDISRNYPVQILFKLHEEGGGAPKTPRSSLRCAGYYEETESGCLRWVAERGDEVKVNSRDLTKIRHSNWKSRHQELWLELSWDLDPEEVKKKHPSECNVS